MTETSTNRARAAVGLPAATGQPGTELTPLDNRIARIRVMQDAFADAVAAGLTPQTLVRDAITAVRNVPDLAKCEEQTFFGALMTAAQLGLRPNVSSIGHGWVLPYWSSRRNRFEANWILGYQGMIELGYRSGLVTKITAHTIYSNERHRVVWGSNDALEHEPIFDRAERGERLLHYAVVHLNTGGQLWNVISDADAQEVMAAHAARDRNKNIVGPWRDDYEPMARKTALRGLWRYMPKTPAMALALATDGVVRVGTDKDPALDEPEVQPTTVLRVPEGDGADVVDAQATEALTAEQLAEQQLDEAYRADVAAQEQQPQ
jgi:recombination protein RecT